MTGQKLDRLLSGNGLDTYGTEAFGTEAFGTEAFGTEAFGIKITPSEKSKQHLQRLAELNQKELYALPLNQKTHSRLFSSFILLPFCSVSVATGERKKNKEKGLRDRVFFSSCFYLSSLPDFRIDELCKLTL